MNSCKVLGVVLAFASIMCIASAAQAQTTWHVDATNCPGPGFGTSGDPFCMIQDGIDAASPGDEVVIADGTYTGVGNKDLDFGGRAITVRSAGGPENCIIDCEDSGRGFYFHSGETNASIVVGLTITRGSVGLYGGGMFCQSGSPTVKDCIFKDNSAGHGGGMTNGDSSNSGNPTVINCLFIGNTVAGHGGGMHNWNSNPTLINCTFTANVSSTQGDAGMINFDSNPVLTNCIMWGDLWDGSPIPGEISNYYSSSPVVTYCCIEGGYEGDCNIDLDPFFQDAPGGNPRLQLGSPCIDAGNNTAVPPDVTTDLCGNPRIVDGDGDDVAIVDMGTYEYVLAGGQQCEANELAKLLASDGGAGDMFGFSGVAISGGTAVIGAYLDDGGSAYVFTWNGSAWVQVAKLKACDSEPGDGFGHGLDISGDTIVVGAYRDDNAGGADAGSVYVFEKGSGWVDGCPNQVAKLTACDAAEGDMFGANVAVCGDTIVTGAGHHDSDTGAAYVFEKGSGWIDGCTNQVAKLTACDGEPGNFFGGSMACSGDTTVIGAPGQNDDTGWAYVFEKGSGWVDGCSNQAAKLVSCDAALDDEFGISVGIDGDTVVIGAFNHDDNGAQSGAAYIFEKGVGWADGCANQAAKLLASDGQAGNYLGVRVAISGGIAVAGAHYENGSTGSAYVFMEPMGGWANMTENAKLTASDGVGGDQFGAGVAIDGDTAVIGAHYDDDNGSNSGSAYVFGNLSDCDADDILDICESDSDGDGFIDDCDNCPDDYNPNQANSDADSYGDACDNCPIDDNEDQADSDGDEVGDVCDNCPNEPNPDQADCDGDGIGDVCDDDRDGDGVSNDVDVCPDTPYCDVMSDGRPRLDMNNDCNVDGLDIQLVVQQLLEGCSECN